MAKIPKEPKETKPKKPSALRAFAKQFKHKFIAGYLFIECPVVSTSYIISCNWIPKDEYIEEMNIEQQKIGRTITMACVYSKADLCYFVVSHIWLTQILIWPKDEMKHYIEKVLSMMMKNAYVKDFVEPMKIVPETYAEKQKDIKENITVTEKKSAFIERIKDELYSEEFYNKFGISVKTYEAMCKDEKIIVEDFEEETHALELHKFLFNKYRVLLRDTMKVLVDNGIIIQDMNDSNYKSNYSIAREFIACGFGYNETDSKKNTVYPVFSKKGIFTILLLLHDNGILSKQIIPKLFI